MKEPTRNGNYRTNSAGRGGYSTRVVGSGASAGDFDWSLVNAEELLAFVALVTSNHDLVSFGVTSDGGVASIAVIHDRQAVKAYAKDADDVLVKFRDIREDMGY